MSTWPHDLGRPPAEHSELDPNDVAGHRTLPSLAGVAVESSLRRFDGQALGVEAGGARVAADEAAAVGTLEAPVDVDAAVLLWLKVLRTNHLRFCDLFRAWRKKVDAEEIN